MAKTTLEKNILVNLSELKDLRLAISHVLKAQESVKKAMPQEKPKLVMAKPDPSDPPQKVGNMKYLGRKLNHGLGHIEYMFGQHGSPQHYSAKFDMNASKHPWSVELKNSNDGSILARSHNMHQNAQDVAADIAHHDQFKKWKNK